MVQLTPVVKNLIIINVIIFFSRYILPGLDLEGFLALRNVRAPEWAPYQLFTYMFAHGDFYHILFNMMALSFFGPILEATWGGMRFLAFYMITGIGAGVFNILVDLYFGVGGFGAMVGASGAVYGTLTAFAFLYPNMEIRLLFPPINLKAKYLLMIFGGLALYSALSPRPGDNTANFAHLGGIVVGAITVQFWRGKGY
jgi:membrane associated rhomboid family serine protease